MGYDTAPEKEVTVTATIRTINQDFESVIITKSETDITSRGIRNKVNANTSKKLMVGQLRVVLIGRELAEKGIAEVLHTLMMDTEITNSVFFAVVDGDTKSLIQTKYENITDIGQHVFNLIDHNIKQELMVSSTLHEVARDYYSPIRSIIMPIVKHEGKEKIELDGIAVFEEDRWVGEYSFDDIFYVKMILDNYQAGGVQLELEGNTISSNNGSPEVLPIALDSIKSKRKIQLVNPDTPEFNLTIDVECRLLETHSTINISDPEILIKLEDEIGKKMESELSRVISYSQEMNSDLFGFGEIYNASVRNLNLDAEKSQEFYPKMKVNTKVNVTIARDGVFE